MEFIFRGTRMTGIIIVSSCTNRVQPYGLHSGWIPFYSPDSAKIGRDHRNMGRKPPIVFRLDNRIRRQSIVGILLLMVAPELSVEPQPSPGDQLLEAKRLVWLNNWSEAA